jgi:hypothetical protein
MVFVEKSREMKKIEAKKFLKFNARSVGLPVGKK